MARCWLFLLFSSLFAALCSVNTMAAPFAPKRHVSVDLIAENTSIQPGQTLTVAVREKIEPGWHTYWINPGDSGEPTMIAWNLPDGVTAGPILWPAPHVIPVGPLANYGYENELLLLTEIKTPPQLPPGDLALSAKVRYLVCKDICVPEEADVLITIPVKERGEKSEFAGPIEEARKALPTQFPGTASYSVNPAEASLQLAVIAQDNLLDGIKDAHFFPLAWGIVSNPAPQQKQISGERLILDLKQGDAKETPATLDGLLVLTKQNGERTGYNLSAARTANPPVLGAKSSNATPPANAGGASSYSIAGGGGIAGGLLFAIFFAFLGGLILNLMPCVFPVLALKAFSFSSAKESHREQGFAYLAGVVASFAVFAALIALLRQGGAALGWGFQFQSPVFVLALAMLFFVLGLSLSGLLSLGAGLASLGDSLTRKPGVAGYFFTGMLASVAATPCTAPFMGAAVGYAMTQPVYGLLAILLALGLGFAAPVFVLSLSPSLQRVLPKPGAWMETLKQVLAFPLYATAAWLVWVLSIQTGSDGVMAAGLTIIGVAFAAWLAGKTVFASLPVKLIAPAIGLAALAFGASIATTAGSGNVAPEAAALQAEPFSQARLDELQSEGKPVFVNLTAAWCITCKVNERIALKSATIANAFHSAGIVYLKGDWTKQNPEITALLHRFGRAGVPLYVFFPGHGAPARVLPQFLTEGLVLDEIKTQSASQPTPKGA